MRPTLIVLHRWLALVLGAIILVVALTGGALVFEGAIDRGLNPQLYRVTPGESELPLDTLLARARAAVPADSVRLLSLARERGRSYMALAGTTQIFVDPFTGRVMGTRDVRDFDRSLPRVLHRMHTSLLAPNRGGGTLVALATVASLVLVITGVIIWWREKLWRILWGASWKRIVYDLHHALGILAALVLFVITASGVIIHYDSLGRAIVRIGGGPLPPPPGQVAPVAGAVRVSVDSLAHAAQHALPEASITSISFGSSSTAPAVIAMRFPEDRTPGGRSRVYVDRYWGIVLRADATRAAPPGRWLGIVMRSVHTGDILGPPTQIIWLLASIVLVSQAVTGFMMWYHMRRARTALGRSADRDALIA